MKAIQTPTNPVVIITPVQGAQGAQDVTPIVIPSPIPQPIVVSKKKINPYLILGIIVVIVIVVVIILVLI
jgi:hypothetical protein